MSDLLRVYFDPDEIGPDGYPFAWYYGSDVPPAPPRPAVKDYVREQAGHRCERCGHPYRKGSPGRGEWSPCDVRCSHDGPLRWRFPDGGWEYDTKRWPIMDSVGAVVEAQWRILTVHHLNGVKNDLRWWNLAALCQRCHLTIQAKVHLQRPYDRPHTEWFKPHAAGYYVSDREPEPSREWVLDHLDEILSEYATQGVLL